MKHFIAFLTSFLLTTLVAVGTAQALTVEFVAGNTNKPITGIEVCVENCSQGNWFDHKGKVVVPGKLSGKTLTWKRVGKSNTVQTGQITLDGRSTYTVKLSEILSDDRGFDIDDFELQLLHVLNQRRAERGLGALQLEHELNVMATYHANYLEANQLTGHVGASGSNSQFRASEAGVIYPWGVGETVQKNHSQIAEAIIDAFQTSPAHWEILMGRDFYTVGIAHIGEYTVINPKQSCRIGCSPATDNFNEETEKFSQQPEESIPDPQELPNSKSELPNPKRGDVKQQLVKVTVRKGKTVKISLRGLTPDNKIKVQNKKHTYKLKSKGKSKKIWKSKRNKLSLSGKLPRKFEIVILTKTNTIQQIIKVI